MREDLLGYLLGALEPDEEREIEDRLEADPELRRKLRTIRRGLEPLSSDDGLIDGPTDLAARTCRFIDQPPAFEHFQAANEAPLREGASPAGAEGSTAGHAPIAEGSDSAALSAGESVPTPSLPRQAALPRQTADEAGEAAASGALHARSAATGPTSEAPAVVRPASASTHSPRPPFEPAAATRRWGMADALVTAGVFAAASMLLIPALSVSRYEAQVTACRQRLHRLGTALVDYSRIRGGVFPEVVESGPLSRAGVYPARLREARLIGRYADVTCPAAYPAEGATEASGEDPPIPELSTLSSKSDPEVDALVSQRQGIYGYALGYVDDAGYHVRRNRNRSTFIVLADVPHDGKSGSRNHGCGGQNVWFEDGHVEFLNSCRISHLEDQIFENRQGFVGAGVGPDDIVIGRETARPLIVPVGHTP